MGSFRRFPGSWRRLGDVPADRTRAAFDEIVRALRTISHYAAGPGPCRFVWEDDGSMLVTAGLSTAGLSTAGLSMAVALRPTDLCVIVLPSAGAASSVLPLHGRSPAGLAAWLIENADGAEGSAPADESILFEASDRAALSEAARWLNNAADVLDHLGLAGQLDLQSGRFEAATKSDAGGISLQSGAVSPDEDSARLPAFHATGSTPGFLHAADLAQLTASGQASQVEAFLSGLADSTR